MIQRTTKLPANQMTNVSPAPGRSRFHGVRTGTLTWYSEVSETTYSSDATGQYNRSSESTCSGSTRPSSSGPARTSGMTMAPISVDAT